MHVYSLSPETACQPGVVDGVERQPAASLCDHQGCHDVRRDRFKEAIVRNGALEKEVPLVVAPLAKHVDVFDGIRTAVAYRHDVVGMERLRCPASFAVRLEPLRC
jgi:hypothetical protein